MAFKNTSRYWKFRYDNLYVRNMSFFLRFKTDVCLFMDDSEGEVGVPGGQDLRTVRNEA